jgi:hypothetical protein
MEEINGEVDETTMVRRTGPGHCRVRRDACRDSRSGGRDDTAYRRQLKQRFLFSSELDRAMTA